MPKERERGGGRGGRIDGRIAFRMTAALALNGSSLIDTPYHTVGLFDQPDLPIEGIGQWQNGDTRLPPPHPADASQDSSLIQCVSCVRRKRLTQLFATLSCSPSEPRPAAHSMRRAGKKEASATPSRCYQPFNDRSSSGPNFLAEHFEDIFVLPPPPSQGATVAVHMKLSFFSLDLSSLKNRCRLAGPSFLCACRPLFGNFPAAETELPYQSSFE